MAPTFPLTFKSCSTCKHWQGERTLNEDQTYHISSSTNFGACKFAKGVEKQAYMKCDNWAS